MTGWVLLLFLATDALARVGGGESYSGGGSDSGSGGGGGGGDGDGELLFYILRLLIWLTIEHPAIGIPVDIGVVIGFVIWKRRRKGSKDVTVFRSTEAQKPVAKLSELRRFDPNFSEAIFADFCYSLYARVHYARGEKDLGRYALYLSDAARSTLASISHSDLQAVKGVIVGSFNIRDVRGLDTPAVTVTLDFESNVTEVVSGGENTWYMRESWVVERKRDILSPPPAKAKADHCPRCGAPLQTRTDGSCDYCGVRIDSGAFHWFVRSINKMQRESRGPTLTSTVPERGTDLPTAFALHFGDQKVAFERAHPGFSWEQFELRVRQIAFELQESWTAREWERIRPLETEPLFQMHRYWIDEYLRQDLRNVVGDFQVIRILPVKIDSDAFYESITVRIGAQGRDHTLDANGRVVAGDPNAVRSWTEYWTFIRNKTAEGGSKTLGCPNCGAPVAVGVTGICPYCSGKLTTGEFDWVLSRIEQDESYGG